MQQLTALGVRYVVLKSKAPQNHTDVTYVIKYYPPSKEDYQLFMRVLISELILKGKRPDSLISQGRRRSRRRRKIKYYCHLECDAV
jgi:hypothetical protein